VKYVNQYGKKLGRRNAYPGERRGPLDNGQKARLCIMAREAFEKMHGRAPASAAELEAWRREQQQKACGLLSLTFADQKDYPALEAHFLDLLGESGKAFMRLLKPELKEQRQALAVLARDCRERGLNLGYPSAICRKQYKCTLEEASPKQIWRLVFTIRNRRQAK